MTGMPTDALDLADAATDNSATPATAFGGAKNLGTGLNEIIADAEATGTKVGPGASAPARGKALVGTGVTSASGKQQSIWDRFSRRNLIVNGTGRTKQRATMPTTDNSYAIDRMRLLMENANGFTITQETSTLPAAPGAKYGYRFTVGSGTNGKGGGFWPVISPSMGEVAGGVLSLQAALYISNARLANLRIGVAQFTGSADAISGDPVTTWGADGTNPTLAASWSFANTPTSLALSATTWAVKYAENVSISASATNVAVVVWNDARTTTAADFFIVTDIQLERGAVSTAIERVDEGEERALCRDWLRAFGGDDASEYIGSGPALGATQAVVFIPFGHPLWKLPTSVTVSAATHWSLFDSTSGAVACNGTLTLNNPSRNAVEATVTVAAGLSTSRPVLMLANTLSARLFASAEP